jgi:hypothetical protein
LLDSSINASIRSYSRTFSPVESPIRTLGVLAARFETVTVSFIRPLSSASNAVMILVVLAIAMGSRSFLPHNMRPVSASINTAESAATSGGSGGRA